MAMTVQQAQQLVESTASDQDMADAYQRYLNGDATEDDIALLTDPNNFDWYAGYGLQPPSAAQIRANSKAQQGPADKVPVYHPPTAKRGAYYTDPDTGIVTDINGNVIAQPPREPGSGTFMDWLGPPQQNPDSSLYWGPGTSSGFTQGYGATGGTGVDHYATDASIAQQLRELEEKKREFGLTFEEQKREFDLQNQLANQQAQQGYLQNRATTGLNLADFQRGLANDVYQRALDPGNYPAYLAASAGLPQGAGSPISALIGQGAQIQPPGGSNPLADPRFQNLMSNLYEYAQPGALQTVQGIAAQHGGTLPPEFYAYTHTQPPKYATGGEQVVNSPVIGVDAYTGQPKFIAGEAGEEKITFQPTHHHETAGMPTPHVHGGGEAKHEHQGQVIQYADGGVAYAGSPTVHQLQAAWNAYHPNDQHPDNVYTPAEGTAISLGKALQPLGYVPQYLIQQLSEGRTPTPGSVDESLLQRLPPSLRALLQAQIRSALGGAGVMDYNQELQNQQFAGVNSGRTYNSYQ